MTLRAKLDLKTAVLAKVENVMFTHRRTEGLWTKVSFTNKGTTDIRVKISYVSLHLKS